MSSLFARQPSAKIPRYLDSNATATAPPFAQPETHVVAEVGGAVFHDMVVLAHVLEDPIDVFTGGREVEDMGDGAVEGEKPR